MMKYLKPEDIMVYLITNNLVSQVICYFITILAHFYASNHHNFVQQ